MKKEQVVHNGELQAVVLYNGPIDPGVYFYGKNKDALQVGKQLRLKGEKITPHKHVPVKIEREEVLPEFLYIEKGKVKITFYTEQWEEIGERVLGQCDMILFMRGGHGFEMIEETVMIEVKEGPYNPAATQKIEEK